VVLGLVSLTAPLPSFILLSQGDDQFCAASDLEQFASEGGTASMKKRKVSAPRDPTHVMASGLVAASDLEQFASEGGNAGSKNRQQRLKEEDQKVYEVGCLEGHDSQHLLGLGLSVPVPIRKPKYDPFEIGRLMDEKNSEFFEGDKPLPGRGKGKARHAERMGLNPRNTAFRTAWDQREDSKFRRAKLGPTLSLVKKSL
jgi:hypothetical protein